MLKYPSVKSKLDQEDDPGKPVVYENRSPIKTNRDSKRGHGFNRISHGYTSKFNVKPCELSSHQVLIMAFLWSLQPFNVANTCFCIMRWGALEVMLGYVILNILMVTPLTMVYLFFGQYNTSSFIKFWDMFPLFKGIGWSLILYQVSLEVLNITDASISLIYLLELLKDKLPWSDCSFPEASEKCYPMYPDQPYTNSCCNNIKNASCPIDHNQPFVWYPAMEYLFLKILKTSFYGQRSWLSSFRMELVVAVLLTWLMIYLSIFRGIQKFSSGIIQTLTIMSFGIISVFGTYLLLTVGVHLPTIPSVHFNKDDIGNPKFWISLSTHVLHEGLPFTTIFLGSASPANMQPTLTAIKITFMKFIGLLSISVMLSIIVQMTYENYKIEDYNCIIVEGVVSGYCIMTDILARYPYPYITSCIWFMGIWLMSLTATANTIGVIYISIMEVFPKIARYRTCITGLLCFTICLFNICICTGNFIQHHQAWRTIIIYYVPINIVFISVLGISIYSFKKINVDYYFTYGVILHEYWSFCLQLTLFLTSIISILYATGTVSFSINILIPNWIKLYCYLYSSLIVLSVIFIGIVVYIKSKSQIESTDVLEPSYSWGPKTTTRKHERLKFNPDRQMALNKSEESCKHNCLLNSQKLRIEIEALKKNIAYLKVDFKED